MIRFLFKSVFLLTVIFVAIAFLAPEPDRSSRNETADTGSAFDALFAIRNTVTDLGRFCERNPETCKTGKSLFVSLSLKARDGARITYEFLDAKFGRKETGHTELIPPARPVQSTQQTIPHQKKHIEEKQPVPQ